MRKIYLNVLLISITLILNGCIQQKGKYCTGGGKDTTAEIGLECRFHLIQGYEYKGNWTNRLHVLKDRKNESDLLAPVFSYEISNKTAYFLGNEKLTKINLKTNKVTTHRSLEELKGKEKDIYQQLEKHKKNKIKKYFEK